jgi:flagellar FliJ protein
VRKLIERRLTEVRTASDRREQKASDEFASRAAWSPNEMSGVFGGV